MNVFAALASLLAVGGAPRERANVGALWSASTAGSLGIQTAKFALPLVAAARTDSALVVSGVAATLTLPWLVVGLPAGALVDRLDRRLTLVAVNGVRLVAAGALLLASLAGSITIPLLFVCAALLGIADTFGETVLTALAPAVAGGERLEAVNARVVAAQTATEIAGPPLGGLLAAVALGLTAGASAACFALALASALALRGRFMPERGARRHLLAEVAEGVRFLWRHRLLRAITGMAAVINACWSAWAALLVLYAVAPGPVGLSTVEYGLLMTAGGVGGLLGALAATAVLRRFGRRWAIGINVGVNALMFATTALTDQPLPIAAAILIGDIGGPIWVVAVQALQARSVPDGLRGRIASGYRFVSFGAMAVGAALGGVAADLVGIRAVFAGCAVLTAALFVPFALVVTEAAMTRDIVE